MHLCMNDWTTEWKWQWKDERGNRNKEWHRIRTFGVVLTIAWRTDQPTYRPTHRRDLLQICEDAFKNKPDRATMRPDCVSACIEFDGKHVAYIWRDRWTNSQMNRQFEKSLSKRVCWSFDSVKDLTMVKNCREPRFLQKRDGRKYGRTDRRTDPLIEMRSRRTQLKNTDWRGHRTCSHKFRPSLHLTTPRRQWYPKFKTWHL